MKSNRVRKFVKRGGKIFIQHRDRNDLFHLCRYRTNKGSGVITCGYDVKIVLPEKYIGKRFMVCLIEDTSKQNNTKPKTSKKFSSFKSNYIRKVCEVHGLKYDEARNYLDIIWTKCKDKNDAVKLVEKNFKLEQEEKRKDTKKVHEPNGFPEFVNLDDVGNKLIENTVRNVILDSNLKIKFNMQGVYLGIKTKEQWSAFCNEFMVLSLQISKHFGVENKFKRRMDFNTNTFFIVYNK